MALSFVTGVNDYMGWHNEAELRIYASATKAIIGSDNGLSSVRRQAIIWNNVGILSIEPLGTNFNEILIEIQIFLFKKCIWKCRLKNVNLKIINVNKVFNGTGNQVFLLSSVWVVWAGGVWVCYHTKYIWNGTTPQYIFDQVLYFFSLLLFIITGLILHENRSIEHLDCF